MTKKVALFVCHDLVGLLMLNTLVPRMAAMGLTPVIFNTRRHRNRRFRVPTPPLVSAFNAGLLEEVILPSLERAPAGASASSYKQLAQAHGAEYHEIEDVNTPALLEKITQDNDICGAISMRFLQVFDTATISALRAKGFFWNLHSGLLGDYKGLLLPYRAIENGEKEYGVTLHETTAGIDEGAIIAKGALPLNASKPVMELYMDTVSIAAGIIETALDTFQRELPLACVPQNGGGSYYSNPTTQEFISYMQKGIVYADPETTLQRIADAFTPAGTPQNRALRAAIQAFVDGEGDIGDAARRLA